MVSTATIHDDGTGPALYVAGTFSVAGGAPALNIARWDGAAWAPLGAGLGPSGIQVRALASVDPDGSGPNPAYLYAGGSFMLAGGQPAPYLARWDGSSWAPVAELNNYIQALLPVDEGPTGPGHPVLYAGGGFTQIGAVNAAHVARWDGAQWSALGTGTDGDVWALAALKSGGSTRPTVFAGGGFINAGGISASCIAGWDGQAWSALGTGIGSIVMSLAIFDDDGPGPHPEALYAAGRYDRAGSVQAHCIAKWDGADWSDLNGGTGIHDFFITTTLVWDDDGPGPNPAALYVGGNFDAIGGIPAYRTAKWNGLQWAPLPGLGPQQGRFVFIYSLAAFDRGDGDSLFAGCRISEAGQVWGLARWGCPCYANCDASTTAPILNVLDFVCFLNRFAAGDARANCDGSTAPPVLNALDFGCFLNRFAAGCP